MGPLASLPQKVRIRLLASGQATSANASLALEQVVRRQATTRSELQFRLALQRTQGEPVTLPIAVNLDGVRSQLDLNVVGQNFRWRHRAALPEGQISGWGSFGIPDDANRRDNITYFVYGAEAPSRACVVSTDAGSGPLLQLAVAALLETNQPPVTLMTPASVRAGFLADRTLLLWQAPLPEGSVAEEIRSFVVEGGAVMFLAPGQAEATRFNGAGWSEVQSAENGQPFRILRWDQEQGPLAKTDEGLSLPLPQVSFLRRQAILGNKNVLAAFEDGTPLLTRQTLGKGEIYFCASLPAREWSSL